MLSRPQAGSHAGLQHWGDAAAAAGGASDCPAPRASSWAWGSNLRPTSPAQETGARICAGRRHPAKRSWARSWAGSRRWAGAPSALGGAVPAGGGRAGPWGPGARRLSLCCTVWRCQSRGRVLSGAPGGGVAARAGSAAAAPWGPRCLARCRLRARVPRGPRRAGRAASLGSRLPHSLAVCAHGPWGRSGGCGDRPGPMGATSERREFAAASAPPICGEVDPGPEQREGPPPADAGA